MFICPHIWSMLSMLREIILVKWIRIKKKARIGNYEYSHNRLWKSLSFPEKSYHFFTFIIYCSIDTIKLNLPNEE